MGSDVHSAELAQEVVDRFGKDRRPDGVEATAGDQADGPFTLISPRAEPIPGATDGLLGGQTVEVEGRVEGAPEVGAG